MNPFIVELFTFMVMGTLGAAIYVLVKAESWDDFTTFQSLKRLLLGPFCGFIYHLLYSQHNFPNMFMSLVSGYFGTDFIVSVMSQYQKRMQRDE